MEDKILVRCPACGTLNRIPARHAGLSARCGECKAGLPAAGPQPGPVSPADVTDASFDGEVRRSSRPVLVEFWGRSCGHCIRMGPVMDELAKELSGRLKVAKLEVNDNPGTASLYGINATPAFVLVKDGREAGRLVGAMPKAELVRWVRGFI